MSLLIRIIKIGYNIICFLIYFTGIYHIVSFLKRNKPVILYYHSVNSKDCQYIYPDNIVSIENFRRQMAYLSHRKTIISLPNLTKYLDEGVEFPPNVAIITFDDGYYDFYSNAWPILKKYKIPCTLFPITKLLENGGVKWEDVLAHLINTTEERLLTLRIIGNTRTYNLTSQRQKLSCIRDLNSILYKMGANKRCEILSEIESKLNTSQKHYELMMLNWKEIKELQKDKLLSFGSHTHLHRNLAEISLKKSEQEIRKSKEKMEKFIGKPCILFSYPFGKKDNINQEIKKILIENGFLLAVTTIPGNVLKKSDPFKLKRFAAIDDASYKFKCTLIGVTLQRS